MASQPAWSMGTSKRGGWNQGTAPGPGAYSSGLSHKHHAPTWRMGTSSRSELRKNGVPGPGAYNSPGRISHASPKYSMSAKTTASDKGFVPGPGAYDPTALRGYDLTAPSYSMRAKSPAADKSFTPGPGAYDQTSRILNTSVPGIRVGSAKRDDLYRNAATPGPGTYNTRPGSAYGKESGPKYGFGSEERGKIDGMSKTLPGPGAYTFRGDFESPGKGTSMVPRRPDSAAVARARSPGPGAYNPGLENKNKSPNYRIGSASRDGSSAHRIGTPGPGAYDPSQAKGHQNIKIGTSVRRPLSASAYTPGPGTYETKPNVGEGPRYIMNPRREDNTKSANDRYIPGPGAYSPNVSLTKLHQANYRIGTGQRSELHAARNNPGPGQYDTRKNLGGPRWGFGSEIRGQNLKNSNPGPGQYMHKSYVGDVPKYAYGSGPLKIHL